MKKVVIILMGLLLIACGKKEEKIKIGVTQIVEHPALDSTVVGLKKALSDGGYGDIDIEVQNAQGDFATAQTIGGSYGKEKDLIVAVSTPSAQAAYNATKTKPILFTAVTDPVSAGLVGDNISGTSDAAPVDKQLELIKTLLPNAKRIGIVYNTSEQNSIALLKQVKEQVKGLNLEVVERGVTNINEVALGLDSILKEVDVLYTPTDNLIVSATPLVLEKANENNVPVIGCIEDQVGQGALATETIDYEKLGYQTGVMAVKVLNGEDIKEMPVETLKDTKLIINKDVATKYNITLTKELEDRGNII